MSFTESKPSSENRLVQSGSAQRLQAQGNMDAGPHLSILHDACTLQLGDAGSQHFVSALNGRRPDERLDVGSIDERNVDGLRDVAAHEEIQDEKKDGRERGVCSRLTGYSNSEAFAPYWYRPGNSTGVVSASQGYFVEDSWSILRCKQIAATDSVTQQALPRGQDNHVREGLQGVQLSEERVHHADGVGWVGAGKGSLARRREGLDLVCSRDPE